MLDLYAEMASRNENVLEFLDRDGIHLTWDPARLEPTEANFSVSGYLLRCWLILRKGIEVKRRAIDRPSQRA